MKKSIFILFVLVSNLFAQQGNDKVVYLTSNRVDVSTYYQDLKIGDATLSQVAFPISVTIPIDIRTTFSIYNGSALSKYEDTEINGLGDTRIGFRYLLPGDKLILRATASIPTGKTELNGMQFLLSQILTQNPLSYPVSYYGQGFNTSLSLVYATPIAKNLVIGGGASYNYRGKFTPLKSEHVEEFDPGDEITADIGLDVKASNTFRFNVGLLYTLFSKDKMDGVDIFKLGNKVSLFVRLNLRTNTIRNSAFIVFRVRGDNKLFTDSEEKILTNGSQIDVNYVGSIPITPTLSMNVKLDGKFYGTSAQMLGGRDLLRNGKANVFGLGAGARLFLSDLISTDVNLGYKTGSIILPNEDISSSISGFLANLAFTFRF